MRAAVAISSFTAGAEGVAPGRTVAVTMNEMLLRGCMLKNSGHILGLVVYTGEETRIQMNSAETPLKYGQWPPRPAPLAPSSPDRTNGTPRAHT